MGINKLFNKSICLFIIFSMFLIYMNQSDLLSADNDQSFDKQDDNLYVNIVGLNGSDGDCTIITYKNIEILIDAGKDDASYEIITDKMSRIMENDNGKVWDYIIFSHPDDDHIGNSEKILDFLEGKEWNIENIIDYEFENRPKGFFKNEISDKYKELIDNKRKKESINYFSVADLSPENLIKEYTIDENVALVFLYNYYDNYDICSDSQKNDTIKATIGKNNISVCCLLRIGEQKLLFTGDLEKNGEQKLIRYHYESKILENVTFFKAGHHGSDTSNTEEFIDIIRPNVVSITIKKGATFIDETINHLMKYTDYIYPTNVKYNNEYPTLYGDKTFVFDGRKVKLIDNDSYTEELRSITSAEIFDYRTNWFDSRLNGTDNEEKGTLKDSLYIYTFDEGLPGYCNCTLIKHGHTDILIDCGSSIKDSRVFIDKLKKIVVDGIIECVVVTHYHEANYSQLISKSTGDESGVFKEFEIVEIIDSPSGYINLNNNLIKKYIDESNNIPRIQVEQGKIIPHKVSLDISLQIIGCYTSKTNDEDNKSLAVIVGFRNSKALFVGDIDDYDWLLYNHDKDIKNIDFLRLSNSALSLSKMNRFDEFIRITAPKTTVIGSPLYYICNNSDKLFDDEDQVYLLELLKMNTYPSSLFYGGEIINGTYKEMNGDLVHELYYLNDNKYEGDTYSLENGKSNTFRMELGTWKLK